MKSRPRVLVIGQTPPPYHGQALMIDRLVRAQLEGVELFHLRLAFSATIREVGRFRFHKILTLFWVIVRAIVFRYAHRISTLYFVPASSRLVPFFRDVLLLGVLRPLFPRTIFHFRTAGTSSYLDHPLAIVRWLATRIYSAPDGAIQASDRNPPDAERLHAGLRAIIPNGLEDSAAPFLPIQRSPAKEPTILYAGILSRPKGIMVFLEALSYLNSRGAAFRAVIMGAFASADFESEARGFCIEKEIQNRIVWTGELSGGDKWECFLQADMFCFPSFHETESFGNVVLEAMMFELPVIAADWRAVRDLVEDRKTGVVVPPQDAVALAEALQRLLYDPTARERLGQAARKRFLDCFTLQRHLDAMNTFLVDVTSRRPPSARSTAAERVIRRGSS